MNKNLIYLVAINTKLHESVIESWRYYCDRIGCDFKIITENSNEDRTPHWERYNIFNRYPEYDNYLYTDADTVVHWNAPNFFNKLLDENVLYVVRDHGSLEWVYNSILGYNHLFEEVGFNWWDYFMTSFMKFSKKHELLFNNFLKFHDDNKTEINRLQSVTLKKGFDQTPFNYFIRQQNINYEIIPETYSLGHLYKKDILYNGMFIQIPCYVWHFNGINKKNLNNILDQFWSRIKKNYKK